MEGTYQIKRFQVHGQEAPYLPLLIHVGQILAQMVVVVGLDMA